MSAFELDERAIAAGHEVETFETIGSTSGEACARGRAGRRGPLWIVSRHQSAGRGRRGSAWATPPGNLAASLLTSMEAVPARAATLGFVAGVALVEALDACRSAGEPTPPYTLKWPNDVLVGGEKLAGILLESDGRPDGSRFVVVGLGVNVAHGPSGLPYPVTSLAAQGSAADAQTLFRQLSGYWVDLVALWDCGRNFAEIRRLWLARAAGLGDDIVVRSGRDSTAGRFETLDEGGELVVRLADGSVRRVSAGEVHFGLAATVRSGAVG